MSIERRSDYYNEYYKNSIQYNLHYSESVYNNLWQAVLDLIPKTTKIIELGCGSGQFAQMMIDNNILKYVGYDFSEEAIKIAKTKVDVDFIVKDLNNTKFDEDDNFFVALEIFEHIKDYQLIGNLGLGKEIIFTVPDFNDTSHVRYFHSVNEVVNRYMNVIKFEYIRKFDRWYICKGVTI